MYAMQSALDYHHPTVQTKLGFADVLVFQRNAFVREVWDAMEYWRALGKLVVVETDDHYPNIPASNPAFAYWQRNVPELDPHPVEGLKEGLKHADALVSPSKIILKDWEDIVPGYWWPNYPSLEAYRDLPRRQTGDLDHFLRYEMRDEKPVLVGGKRAGTENDIIIGWGGSISHLDSFLYSGVIDALVRLMNENPRVYLKFCGNESRLDYWLAKLPENRVVKQVGLFPQDWPKVLGTYDIGIAPMDMRPVESKTGHEHGEYSYDERRSWLKLVEYVCAGVPFVATKCAPYKDLGRFGKLVENTPKAWYQGLKSRVDGLASFSTQALENRKYALSHYTIEANAKRLIEFYQKIAVETAGRRMGARLPEVVFVQ